MALVIERVPRFLSLLALIPSRAVMPHQKIVVVQSLQTLEKVMARFGTHLTYHVEEVDITVDGENSVALEQVIFIFIHFFFVSKHQVYVVELRNVESCAECSGYVSALILAL